MKGTKEIILSTAFNLFIQKGFSEVSMNDLVKATGLSKGAFYHYFSSKEELYEMTLDRYLVSYFNEFNLKYDENLSLKENLQKLFEKLAEVTTEVKKEIWSNDSGVSNYLLFLQSALLKPEFRSRMDKLNYELHDEFERWIEIAKSKGELSADTDSHVMSRHLASLMNGLSILYSFSVSHDPLGEIFNKIIDEWFYLLSLKKLYHDSPDIK
jgi:TetR/AcrR family transcriptional repressor of nem operon